MKNIPGIKITDLSGRGDITKKVLKRKGYVELGGEVENVKEKKDLKGLGKPLRSVGR